MWPFNSVKSLKESGIFEGFTDWHSHILPGVDDGIKTLDDSLSVLRTYETYGFKDVWLTPHIMEDYPNVPTDLQAKYEELKGAWNGNVKLHLAAENMLDSLFEQRLLEGNILPIGDDGQHILVETSYYTPPMGMDDMIDKIKSKGYYPVLAHPERYRYMSTDDYVKLRNCDVKFQINLISLVGGYGESACKKAEWLLSNGMVDLLGSDLHNLQAFETLIGKSPRRKSHLKNVMEVSVKKNVL